MSTFILDEHGRPLNVDYSASRARDLVHPAHGLLRSERERLVDYDATDRATLVHPLLKTTAEIKGQWTAIEDVPREQIFTGFIGRIG